METATPTRLPTIPARALIGATAVAALLGALVWHAHGPIACERPFIALLRHERPPLARPMLLLWQPLPLVAATASVAWVAWRSGRIRLALAGTLGCALAIAVTEAVLKPLVDRQHQYTTAAIFPSGHVTAAAAWAMFAWLVADPRSQLRSALALVPILVSWAAIATGVHYPTDAIAGALLGGVVVYCTVLGADRIGRGDSAEAWIDLRTTDQDPRSLERVTALPSDDR